MGKSTEVILIHSTADILVKSLVLCQVRKTEVSNSETLGATTKQFRDKLEELLCLHLRMGV